VAGIGKAFRVERAAFTYPPASVQSDHLAADKPFVHRILGQQAGEFADQADMPSEIELKVDAFDDGRPAFFLKAVAYRREPFAADPRHGQTAPQPVSVPQQHRLRALSGASRRDA
jgi:hypothetical protein